MIEVNPEKVLETFEFYSELTRMVIQEDFITFNRHKTFKSLRKMSKLCVTSADVDEYGSKISEVYNFV